MGCQFLQVQGVSSTLTVTVLSQIITCQNKLLIEEHFGLNACPVGLEQAASFGGLHAYFPAVESKLATPLSSPVCTMLSSYLGAKASIVALVPQHLPLAQLVVAGQLRFVRLLSLQTVCDVGAAG